MNSKTKNILKYWRNTLADAARVEIELKKVIHLSDAKIDFEKGAVDPQQAWQLITNQENKINGAKGIESKEHEGWERLNFNVYCNTDSGVCSLASFGACFTANHLATY